MIQGTERGCLTWKREGKKNYTKGKTFSQKHFKPAKKEKRKMFVK